MEDKYYSEELLKLGETNIYTPEEQKLINEYYKTYQELLEEALQWQNLLLHQ